MSARIVLLRLDQSPVQPVSAGIAGVAGRPAVNILISDPNLFFMMLLFDDVDFLGDGVFYDATLWNFLLFMGGVFLTGVGAVLVRHFYKEFQRARLQSLNHDHYRPRSKRDE